MKSASKVRGEIQMSLIILLHTVSYRSNLLLIEFQLFVSSSIRPEQAAYSAASKCVQALL